MAHESGIEWTDSTFNGWIGCTKISPACDHCYASVSTPTRRFGVEWGAGKPRRRTSDDNWNQPRRWNAQAVAFEAEHGRRRRVFCSSLADVFDNEVDPAWRIDLLHLIAETPNLDWLLLTKRIGNAERMLDEALAVMSNGLTRWEDAPWPNVWLGATIANQAEADRDVPKLLVTPAAVRFLSMEPLLGAVNIEPFLRRGDFDLHDDPLARSMLRLAEDEGSAWVRPRLDWIIVGGESGHEARPMHPEWATSLRDQCAAAGVPFLFKQWGEWLPEHELPAGPIEIQHARKPVGTVSFAGDFHPGWHRDRTDDARLIRLGKKHAGRALDGTHHDGYPQGPITWPSR